MAAIPVNWGSGGNNLNPKESTPGRPSMAIFARDVADDLAGIQIAAIAADGSTAVAAADASDLATVITLANETKADFNLLRTLVLDIKTKADAAAGTSLKTTKA